MSISLINTSIDGSGVITCLVNTVIVLGHVGFLSGGP